jgi:hypothetical protein
MASWGRGLRADCVRVCSAAVRSFLPFELSTCSWPSVPRRSDAPRLTAIPLLAEAKPVACLSTNIEHQNRAPLVLSRQLFHSECGTGGSMVTKYIRCIAKYEDGSESTFSVSEHHLRGSDSVLIVLAGEAKSSGTLPAGKIVDAYRAPPGGKFP